jgi:hypothetical protein
MNDPRIERLCFTYVQCELAMKGHCNKKTCPHFKRHKARVYNWKPDQFCHSNNKTRCHIKGFKVKCVGAKRLKKERL